MPVFRVFSLAATIYWPLYQTHAFRRQAIIFHDDLREPVHTHTHSRTGRPPFSPRRERVCRRAHSHKTIIPFNYGNIPMMYMHFMAHNKATHINFIGVSRVFCYTFPVHSIRHAVMLYSLTSVRELGVCVCAAGRERWVGWKTTISPKSGSASRSQLCGMFGRYVASVVTLSRLNGNGCLRGIRVLGRPKYAIHSQKLY